MSIELLFLLIPLWLVAGAVDAWILDSRRRLARRWLLVCVLTGPLSVAAVFDQIYLVEPDDAERGTDDDVIDDVGGVAAVADAPVEWPDDDPEGRLIPYGFRKLSDD